MKININDKFDSKDTYKSLIYSLDWFGLVFVSFIC